MVSFDAHLPCSPQSCRRDSSDRHLGLTDQLATTFNAMREIAKALPADQQRQLEGKIVVAEVTHQALMNEFGAKP